MTQVEKVIRFECEGRAMLGILAPGAQDAELGVVVVVGGPQYRAGSHRQFVTLSRAMAEQGHPALRFDARGMGDSEGPLPRFEDIGPDIGAAIDALQHAAPSVRRVGLWGLCDGASAALLYLHDRPDPRVAGLCIVNPWVRSEASLAKTHVKHYYRQRLGDRAFWTKLLSGGVSPSALAGLWRSIRSAYQSPAKSATPQASYQTRMALAWERFPGPIHLLLSDSDYTAREFEEYTRTDVTWQAALAAREPQRIVVHGADHTCAQPAARHQMHAATRQWLAALAGGA